MTTQRHRVAKGLGLSLLSLVFWLSKYIDHGSNEGQRTLTAECSLSLSLSLSLCLSVSAFIAARVETSNRPPCCVQHLKRPITSSGFSALTDGRVRFCFVALSFPFYFDLPCLPFRPFLLLLYPLALRSGAV
jgi:hypothetical protein